MFMVASAEAVARRELSGENLAQVIPRAWAFGRLKRGLNERVGRFGWRRVGVEVEVDDWEFRRDRGVL